MFQGVSEIKPGYIVAAKMKVGWNIGNTLEAIGGETMCGNPLITEQLIKLAKDNGFNAIRLPCAWDQYLANRQQKLKQLG